MCAGCCWHQCQVSWPRTEHLHKMQKLRSTVETIFKQWLWTISPRIKRSKTFMSDLNEVRACKNPDTLGRNQIVLVIGFLTKRGRFRKHFHKVELFNPKSVGKVYYQREETISYNLFTALPSQGCDVRYEYLDSYLVLCDQRRFTYQTI